MMMWRTLKPSVLSEMLARAARSLPLSRRGGTAPRTAPGESGRTSPAAARHDEPATSA
jgi:hypothetical protein